MTISCKQALENLLEYLDGHLPPQARQAIEQHLASCECCPELLASYQKTSELCQKALKRAMPEGMAQRLMECLRQKTKN